VTSGGYSLPIAQPLLMGLLVLVGGSAALLLCTPYYLLAPVPALALLVVLLLGCKPQLGFYLMLFSIPIDQYRTLSATFPSLTLTKVLGILLVAILCFRVVVQRQRLPLKSKLWAPLGLFLVVNLLAFLFTRYPETAMNELRQIVTALVFFALALVLIRRQDFFGAVPKVIVLSISLGALLSLYGYVFNDPLFAVHVDAGSLKRGVGASNDPNLFSLSLLFAMPLLLHYALHGRGLWRLLAVALFGLNALALVLTFSRGGALNFAVLLALLFWEHRKYLRPRYIGLLASTVMAAAMITLLLTPAAYWERQRTVTDTSDSSISRRMDYIVVAWDAFRDHPLLGSGPGTFIDCWGEAVVAGKVEKGESRNYRRPAHNTYLEVLVGSGVLGLGFYLLVVLWALQAFVRSQGVLLREGDESGASLVGAFKVAFLSVLFYFLILSAFYHKFFWVSLALSQLALHFTPRVEVEPCRA